MRLSDVVAQWTQVPPFVLAGVHLLAAVLLVVVGFAWGGAGRRRLLVPSTFLAVLGITVAYVTMVRPSDIPIDWITVLTRGFERKTIMHLYARGAHAGPAFSFVLSTIAAGRGPTLHDVVWLNLLLAMVNAVIFLHIAIHIAGPRWAPLWTVAFVLNPATFLASFSELPTNLLALYFMIGLFAWAVLNEVPRQPCVIRLAAGALCALITMLVAQTRLEVSLIGVVALALYGGQALLGAARWSAAWPRFGKIFERSLDYLSRHPVLVGGLTILAWCGPQGTGREEFWGLYPFNPSILGLFVFLPMLGLPIGASISTFFGFLYGTMQFLRFGGLPLSLVLVVRSYFGVQDSYLETGRYVGYVLPAIFLLGLFGKRQLQLMIQSWPPTAYRVARIVYVMSWFTLPLPGVLEFYLRSEYTEPSSLSEGVSELLLDRNTQNEMRHLLALTERNPECVFVGRVLLDRGDFRRNPQYEYAVFGVPMTAPAFVPEAEARLDEVIARYAAGASCVRLYYGGDCNVRLGDHCERFIVGRHLLEEERFWSRPYNSNPWDSGAPEIVLATYAWP